MCSKRCQRLLAQWQRSRVSLHCSSYSSVAYDANGPRCVRRCAASESRVDFLQLFRSCGPSLNLLLITVCEPEGAVVRVGPSLQGTFWTLPLFELMWAFGLAPRPFSPCETPHTLKQIQFTAQCTQKPWHETEKVLLILWTGCCGNG